MVPYSILGLALFAGVTAAALQEPFHGHLMVEEQPKARLEIGSSWEALGPFPAGTREHSFISSPAYAYLPNKTASNVNLDRIFAELPYGWAPGPSKPSRESHPLSTNATSLGAESESETIKVDGRGWPTPLSPDGLVGWQHFETTSSDGYTEVSYPDIRWDQLRAHQGWTALQYQVLMRGDVEVIAPIESVGVSSKGKVLVEMELIQGQEFALVKKTEPGLPETDQENSIIWYNGDIYSYALTLSADSPSSSPSSPPLNTTSPYSHLLNLSPGKYTLLLRALFEVRMFGEPGPGNAPTIKFMMRGKAMNRLKEAHRREGSLRFVQGMDLVGDVLDGRLMGTYVGLGVRNVAIEEEEENKVVEITDVKVLSSGKDWNLEWTLVNTLDVGRGAGVRVFPGQARVLALKSKLQGKIPSDVKELMIRIESRECPVHMGDSSEIDHRHCSGSSMTMPIQLNHIASSSYDHETSRILFTHLSPTSSPIYSILLPPLSFPNTPYPASECRPTILALHGAGVEASSLDWTKEVPRREKGWAILPTGGTSWGMDWHGASMESALGALEEGSKWIEAEFGGKEKGWSTSEKTVLIGHSNGGQGAWHVAARHPDRFLGVVPGAGYLKIQDYVSYDAWTSDNFADPALMGLLKSALSPFNNDLYASNLAHVPIYAIHGEEDDNVPVWHSRRHVGLVGSWNGNLSTIHYEEVPGKNHWYPDFFKTPDALDFIDSVEGEDLAARLEEMHLTGYTVTTANPDETGGKGGVRIAELEVPGRLARIEILPRHSGDLIHLKTSNVASLEMEVGKMGSSVVVNGQSVELSQKSDSNRITITKKAGRFHEPSAGVYARPYGPMIRILSSPLPPAVIYGTIDEKIENSTRGIAVRLAHDAQVYQRIEMEIVDDKTALRLAARGELDGRNVIVLGTPHQNIYAKWMQGEKSSPVTYPAPGIFEIENVLAFEQDLGIIYLAQHPTNPARMACVIAGADEAGLEQAFRLFPVRTGVPVPDWVVVSGKSRWQGAGGFLGAGFWDKSWGWSASMSWLSS